MTARAKVWSGRHNKWVYAPKRRLCPICKQEHGGKPGDPVVGDQVCEAHPAKDFKHLPKKVWPRWTK